MEILGRKDESCRHDGGEERMEDFVRRTMRSSADLVGRVADAGSERIVSMAAVIADVFRSEGKLLLCGNGGSASDAQHLATELTIRYRKSVLRRALPAIALSADTSALTAGANDLGYDQVFARLVEAYGRSGDVLLGISTSGNSMSVYNALRRGRSIGMHTLALLGGDGGRIREVSDHSIIVPYAEAADRVQECHIVIGHVIIDCIERMLGYCVDSPETGK
ncbi:phosphoheptose isomerase [Prosthecochloris sp. GSB1]|uniref:D-sedoheptulose-7-phosphate isomerase n=1 Tax=Prosthecochloris sp. GSB1 TaxID=281093 RepID=UPI000B8C7023|nr:SIS domain-containing protein [Prosthecochloris sp. GSB1]ASQ89735.1 phosphoheptose isomerase [Prosthecochloris sp. GSB1]